MTADEILAGQAQPREHLLDLLRAAPQPTDPNLPWQVIRQTGQPGDVLISCHRWEWIAYRRARRLTALDEENGARYDVRRAAA